MKLLNCLKGAIITTLAIIVGLWFAYFLDSLNKSQHHFFEENNYALNILKWINEVSNRKPVLGLRFFGDNFYLEDFPGIIFFVELFFVILIIIASLLQKQKRKQYFFKLCISIICFVILFEFLDASLKLFVPG